MIGSDLIVQQLDSLEIEYIALNPGATLRGLHESLLNGSGQIRPITTLHEAVAVGMAHGFAKASGRTMAVGLHDTVGVLNAALAIYNAWADEVPILIIGGVGPLDGPARRAWIDWVHTTTDTPRPIRDVLVWAETPLSMAGALESLRRADRRARSQPAGPAYVGLDVGLQESGGDDAPGIKRSLTPWKVAPEPAAINAAADLLQAAASPLIATDRPLTNAATAALVSLAERLGAALVELEGAANVPWGHPLDRSSERAQALAGADVILAVDVRDAGLIQGHAGDAASAGRQQIIDVATSPLRESSWMVSTSEPADTLHLVGDAEATIKALLERVKVDGSATMSVLRAPAEVAARDTIDPSAELDKLGIAIAAGSVLPLDRVVVAHGALAGHAREQLRLQQPSQYLGRSGGEGLGYALPAAVGAALAYKGSDRVVVAFLTDGDTLYLPQALWTAAHEHIPLLAIIENNRTYWRDEVHQRAAAEARGRDPEVAASGVRLAAPAMDLTGLVRSFGVGASDPVRTVAELAAAIHQGLRVLEQGEPYVIEALGA